MRESHAHTAETGRPPLTVAALDLGSNSFHMIVARFQGQRLMIIDRLKDMVRLAAGLDPSHCLSEAAMEHGLASLSRMRQRIRELPDEQVRIVGTNTLRKAHNGEAFTSRASDILGHEVEIISGREEARLIYLGVSHSLEDDCERRLVVDIGGGSTELILGRQFQPEVMDSLYMGCVSMSERHFPGGRITAAGMKAARLEALHELEPLLGRYRQHGWDVAIGASGTILAIQDVVAAQGWGESAISAEALERLCQSLIKAGDSNQLDLPGLPDKRAPVFPGGVAILAAIFEALQIDRMRTASGALREGLLWDLLGRQEQADIREQTVADLERRYHIDQTQAGLVEHTALRLFDAVCEHWDLHEPSLRQLLRWAARLHEIGMDIAYSQYHKHGAYLLQNLEMPGFSRTEQRKLALLVRAHRRKFPRSEFAAQVSEQQQELQQLALLLRVAVHLHRARDPQQQLPLAKIGAGRDRLALNFDPAWLEQHPLTRLDLEGEVTTWNSQDLTFSYQSNGSGRH